MLGLEDNLVAEIEFWRDLIESRSTDAPTERLERMQQALALAEHKLQIVERATGSTLLPGAGLQPHGSTKEH
ncbi:MAG: hypothetical protein AAGH19_03390 [Pseudomonadota bacterium]